MQGTWARARRCAWAVCAEGRKDAAASRVAFRPMPSPPSLSLTYFCAEGRKDAAASRVALPLPLPLLLAVGAGGPTKAAAVVVAVAAVAAAEAAAGPGAANHASSTLYTCLTAPGVGGRPATVAAGAVVCAGRAVLVGGVAAAGGGALGVAVVVIRV